MDERTCVYCNEPITNNDWYGVGQPMEELFAHFVCDPIKLRARVEELRHRAARAERVCFALWRVRNVPDSVDPEGDARHLTKALCDWYQA